jgi:hypothetical protein
VTKVDEFIYSEIERRYSYIKDWKERRKRIERYWYSFKWSLFRKIDRSGESEEMKKKLKAYSNDYNTVLDGYEDKKINLEKEDEDINNKPEKDDNNKDKENLNWNNK